jgi:Na+-transporting NADH:ubiquinone oxidoreductase subunit NqrB
MGIGGGRTALLRKVLPGKVVQDFLETAKGTRSSTFWGNLRISFALQGVSLVVICR